MGRKKKVEEVEEIIEEVEIEDPAEEEAEE